MYRAIAELLTFATIPIWLLAMAYTFVARAWHFLPSFLLASLLVAPFLCVAVLLEHRSASIEDRAPRSFFPDQLGFCSFLFATSFCALAVGYAVAMGAVALNLPGGDSWSSAWARLLFYLAAFLIAFLLYQAMTWVSQRWLTGRIYDDWLNSMGEPVTSDRIHRELDDGFTRIVLVAIFVLGIAVCCFGMDWTGELLDLEVDRGSRMRKLQAKIRWLVAHPNTVRLFSGFIAAFAGIVLAWMVLSRHRLRSELGEFADHHRADEGGEW